MTAFRGLLAISVLSCWFAVQAQAQQIPGYVPGQEDVMTEQLEIPAPRDIELLIPPPPPPALPEEMLGIALDVEGVDFVGVTAFSEQELQELAEPFLAMEPRTVGGLYDLAEALTMAYRERGYILSFALVPSQQIVGARAEIRAVEGYISRIVVQSAGNVRASIAGQVEALVQPVVSERPVTNATLERGLLLANDLPGVTAQAVLSPDPELFAAAEMTVLIEFVQYDAIVSFDNELSEYYGRDHYTGTGFMNNGFGFGEQLVFEYQRARDASRFWAVQLDFSMPATAIVPTASQGLEFGVQHFTSESNPTHTIALLGLEADTESWEFWGSYPVILSRRVSLDLEAGLRTRTADSTLLGVPNTEDNIRSAYIGGSFFYVDGWAGINALSFEVEQTLPVWGATDQGDPLSTRPEADNHYTILRGSAIRVQDLPMPGVDVFVATEGQYTTEPLHASNEFVVGGINIGRGYEFGEIVGDYGIAGKVELRYTMPYDPFASDRFDGATQFFGFWDVGQVFNRDDATNDTGLESQSLSSAGFGTRMAVLNGLDVEFLMAYPLTKPRSTAVPGLDNPHGPRFYFDVNYVF